VDDNLNPPGLRRSRVSACAGFESRHRFSDRSFKNSQCRKEHNLNDGSTPLARNGGNEPPEKKDRESSCNERYVEWKTENRADQPENNKSDDAAKRPRAANRAPNLANVNINFGR
jgi:hypothetical protein